MTMIAASDDADVCDGLEQTAGWVDDLGGVFELTDRHMLGYVYVGIFEMVVVTVSRGGAGGLEMELRSRGRRVWMWSDGEHVQGKIDDRGFGYGREAAASDAPRVAAVLGRLKKLIKEVETLPQTITLTPRGKLH